MATTFHLAQANIARMRAPLDDPRMADFVAALDPINALADRSQGLVWRLKTASGDATVIRAFDDERILFNMSVWESLDALRQYVPSIDDAKVRFARLEANGPGPDAFTFRQPFPAPGVPS